MKFFKKSLIVLIISCLNSLLSFGQHGNSFVGARFGPALPMGEFASHDYGNGGYALLGKSYGAEAAWFVTPKIGFGADISFSTFGFASGYFAEDYIESEPAFSHVDLLSGPYSVKTFMGGAFYKLPVIGSFFSTFKLMGGFFMARTPDQFFGVDAYSLGKTYFWKTAARNTKFTFLAGASLEYKLYQKVSLLLQADFTYAKPGFPFTKGGLNYVDYMQMPIFQLLPGINVHF